MKKMMVDINPLHVKACSFYTQAIFGKASPPRWAVASFFPVELSVISVRGRQTGDSFNASPYPDCGLCLTAPRSHTMPRQLRGGAFIMNFACMMIDDGRRPPVFVLMQSRWQISSSTHEREPGGNEVWPWPRQYGRAGWVYGSLRSQYRHYQLVGKRRSYA